MTSQNFNIPTPSTTIKTIITDTEGNELDSFVWEEKTIIQPDGTISKERTNYGKILEGDTYYDPLMGKGPKPIRIGACYFCRHKASSKKSKSKKSGIITLGRARICFDCFRLGCSAHVRRSADSKFRCRICRWKYRIRTFFKNLFYYYEEDD